MKEEEEKVKPIKILLIGNSSVGKSSILMQYSDKKFKSMYSSTIGIDFKRKILHIQGKNVPVTIWDTAGQDRFKTITNSYYRGTDGILIVYDVTDEESFQNVQHWLKEIEKCTDQQVERYIIGNKSDLDQMRMVPQERGRKFAESLGLPFMETSAKMGTNINMVFDILTKTIMAKREGKDRRKLAPESEKLKLEDIKPEKEKGCC